MARTCTSTSPTQPASESQLQLFKGRRQTQGQRVFLLMARMSLHTCTAHLFFGVGSSPDIILSLRGWGHFQSNSCRRPGPSDLASASCGCVSVEGSMGGFRRELSDLEQRHTQHIAKYEHDTFLNISTRLQSWRLMYIRQGTP